MRMHMECVLLHSFGSIITSHISAHWLNCTPFQRSTWKYIHLRWLIEHGPHQCHSMMLDQTNAYKKPTILLLSCLNQWLFALMLFFRMWDNPKTIKLDRRKWSKVQSDYDVIFDFFVIMKFPIQIQWSVIGW